jgi:hypothetical protein
MLFVFFPQRAFAQRIDPYTYIPRNAKIYLPVLKEQIKETFPTFPYPPYFGGLIEQESCIALTWNSCWNPKTTLNTSREYGAGLGQLTKAYNSSGQVRFDSLQSIRAQHYEQLHELSWSNILERPDLQMRAIILMSEDNYKRLWMIKNPYQRIAFTDSAYNGGLGGVYQDRRLCGLSADCNPDIWFGNVEKTCSKSKIAIYGHQSPCSINRTHVSNVLKIRMIKYAPYLQLSKEDCEILPDAAKVCPKINLSVSEKHELSSVQKCPS